MAALRAWQQSHSNRQQHIPPDMTLKANNLLAGRLHEEINFRARNDSKMRKYSPITVRKVEHANYKLFGLGETAATFTWS